MRFLGIDYGTKRIGLALSDEKGEFALPHSVINNGPQIIETIQKLCRDNSVEQVVIGESTNYDGSDNQVMTDIRSFAQKVQDAGLETIFEPEFFSSQQAKRDIGKDDLYDARAAAIILQSYLDKRRYARMA